MKYKVFTNDVGPQAYSLLRCVPEAKMMEHIGGIIGFLWIAFCAIRASYLIQEGPPPERRVQPRRPR